MGLKEADNYNTGDENDKSALPRRGRSWGTWFRNNFESIREDGIGRTVNRITSSGQAIIDEAPGFARGLTSGSQTHLLVACLVIVGGFVLVHYMLLPFDEHSNLVPAPALCASQDDEYDTSSRLCRVGNKYAFWFLRQRSWVQCAPNVPGFKILQQNADWQGNYWYSIRHAKEIRTFYDTCIPECATDEDAYYSTKDMCKVTDGVLISWLSGDGQTCAAGTTGEKAIKHATASLSQPNGYWYAPDASLQVRKLLETCHTQCAKNDAMLQDKIHCQVMNTLALKFLSKRSGTCDKRLPGFRALSTMGPSRDVQGAFMYPKALGDQVQQFYLSCMQGWERKGRAATKALPHSAETIKGKSLRRYKRRQDEIQEEKRWNEALLDSDMR